MSTVKITQLAELTTLNSNTQNTLFVSVDVPSGVTGKVTAKTLSQNLYSRNPLKVGLPELGLPNTIAQFANTSNNYVQVNLINSDEDGTADYVVTANTGSDTEYYIDMGYTNSEYNSDSPFNSLGTSINPLDGYLYVQGTDTIGGNLVIGTTTANSVIRVLVGGVDISNVSAFWTPEGLRFNNNRYLTFADDTIQTTAASAAAVTLAAQANTIITQGVDATQNTRLNSIETINTNQNTSISIIEGVNLTQNTNITTANNAAWAAFTKANNALANTTGTFGGTLNISNNLTVNGTVVLANTNFDTTEAAFRITAAGSSQTPTQAGTLMQLTSRANTPARVLIDSFGTSNTAYPIIAGRAARGTVVSPTATQNNDILLRIAGNSYGDTGYAPFGDARIDFVATENHSDTNRGSRIRFWNTPTGSNVVNEIASFNANSVTFTGTVAPERGFIFTPRLPVGNQTAITIDFSSDVIIKANLAADLTFTLTNFVYGKVVEVWLTNTSGSTRTVTHGCSAINSSENSTTFTMASTSSAYLKYFSIDGDLANTFVAVQSA